MAEFIPKAASGFSKKSTQRVAFGIMRALFEEKGKRLGSELSWNRMKSIKLKFLFFCLYLLTCIGCASTPLVAPRPETPLLGFHHRVEAGETLWRISRMYNVELDEIIRANGIADAAKVEKGQLIFIPHYEKPAALPAKHYLDDFIWPLKGQVTATFGQTVNNMINKGINISPYQDTQVVASRGGRVVFYADDFEGFGKTIIIEHADGLSTVYARNAQVFIKVGDSVNKGTPIAKAGSAGRDPSVYLHFEVRKGHIPKNPYFYLP